MNWLRLFEEFLGIYKYAFITVTTHRYFLSAVILFIVISYYINSTYSCYLCKAQEHAPKNINALP